jgi:hypothetical protein
MPKYHIVMVDIIASRERNPQQLMQEFSGLVKTANHIFSSHIISPYTITLGDEFQGVVESLVDSVKTVLWFEEASLKGEITSKFRYVVNYGEIATPLNYELAYGMLGSGLTEAREQLNDKRRGRSRFNFQLPNQQLASQLQRLFEVMSALTRAWKPEEAGLVFDMLTTQNNEMIAAKYGKNRSQIWKRRKNLYIDEYKSLKEILLELSEDHVT